MSGSIGTLLNQMLDYNFVLTIIREGLRLGEEQTIDFDRNILLLSRVLILIPSRDLRRFYVRIERKDISK